jgi:hypothetical protein
MPITRICPIETCGREFEVGGKPGRPPVHCPEHRKQPRPKPAAPEQTA